MSEWPMVKLGEYCDVIMGQAPKGIDVNEDLIGLPLIAGAGDFSSTGVEVSKWTEKPTKICIINDIILSVRATVGTYRFADRDYCLGRGVAALRAKDNLDQKYLSFVIDFYRTKLLSVARGATFLQISKADIGTLMIPLPPLGEQKRIAEILGGVSKAIELVSRQLEILDDGLKTKMWNDADESSHVPLGHYIQKITSGKSLKEGDSEDYQNAVLKISAVTTGYFNEMEVKPLPKSYDPPESHRANNGDILLSRANTTELVGASALVETFATNLFLPDKLWKLQLKDQVNAYFFWHLLQTKIVRSSISKASSGSGGSMKNISQKAFLAISVPEFSNEVQNQIGNIVREQRALRHLLHRKLSLLQELQKSLATRAFAGLL